MKFFLQSHIVKKGETLEQIVALYNVPDIELLKYYHYQNVPKDSNHIGHTLFEEQEIFVPDQKDIEEILLKRKQNLEDKLQKSYSFLNNSVLLPNFSRIDHTYKVRIIDFKENNSESEALTEFEISLHYLGIEEQLHIFRFNKKSFLINGEAPDMKVYELALECSSILFNAELGIDIHGKMISIHNYKFILTNWKQNKQKLLQKYEDINSVNYINEMAETVENKELFQEYFSRDLFLQFYFSLYFNKFWNGKAENTGRFSEYEILYKNQYELNISEDIQINQFSNCIDIRSQQEIQAYIKRSYEEHENTETLESEISANFYLDKDHKILQRADINIKSIVYHTQETKRIQIDMK